MQQVTIYGVSFDMVGKQPIVLLKTLEGNRFLPIWIGHPEAAAILMKLQGSPTPRPMTHDLVTEMLGELNATVAKISVTELRDNTFYAIITLAGRTARRSRSTRGRPMRSPWPCAPTRPIFVADHVIADSAIEFGDGSPRSRTTWSTSSGSSSRTSAPRTSRTS